MSLVRGDNFIFFVYSGSTWLPYACARSGNISVETETLDTSVTGSGDWRTFEASVHSFALNIDGVMSLNDASLITLPELQALQFAKTKILCRFTATSINGDIYTQQFYALIVNSTATGSFDGIATFSIDFKGTGKITQIFTPPSPTSGTVYRYPSQGNTAPVADGTYTVIVPGLGNKEMLGIYRDGLGQSDIILTGTPVGKEVLYETDGTDGHFTWALPFDNEVWYCNYQNI